MNGLMLKVKGARGNINVFMPLGIALLVVMFAAIFLGYYQINIITSSLKKNLFFAANNAILAMDNQELSYGVYSIDLNKAKYIIQELLDKNYENNDAIKGVTVQDLSFGSKNNPRLYIKVKVRYKPVIDVKGINEYTFELEDNIKMSLMAYDKGDLNE